MVSRRNPNTIQWSWPSTKSELSAWDAGSQDLQKDGPNTSSPSNIREQQTPRILVPCSIGFMMPSRRRQSLQFYALLNLLGRQRQPTFLNLLSGWWWPGLLKLLGRRQRPALLNFLGRRRQPAVFNLLARRRWPAVFNLLSRERWPAVLNLLSRWWQPAFQKFNSSLKKQPAF